MNIIIMLLSVLWCILLTIIPSCCSQASSMNMRTSTRMFYSHIEREALLKFKHSLTDPSNRLRSWAGEDCCNWAGIQCDNKTGHVIRLDVRNPHPLRWTRFTENDENDPVYIKSCLVGQEVNPSLLDLKHLKHLDLSWNNFSGISIPNFFGSFSELRYLNLSFSLFGGVIPHHLGNLSNLSFLDLNLFGDFPRDDMPSLRVDNLHWVSGLSHLKYLDLSYVNLSQASNPMQAINSISHLLELHLQHCGIFQNLQSSISNLNLTSLVVLGLGQNDFHGPLPKFIQNMTSLRVLALCFNGFNGTFHYDLSHLWKLESLDLSFNGLSGEVHKLFENSSSSKCFKNSKLEVLDLSQNKLSGCAPNWLGQVKKLRQLDLSYNSFVGPLPPSIWKLSSLRYLNLQENKLNGSISESLGQLSHLKTLILSSNSFDSVLSDIHFANLSNLKYLDLSINSIILKVRADWIPPFQLDVIGLSSCKMGPKFPMWLKTQKYFSILDISDANIKDMVPGWFFNLSSNTAYSDLIIRLSYNQLYGRVPKIFTSMNSVDMNLDHNNFEGPLPHFPSSAQFIDVSHNFFSGPIHHFGVTFPNLQALFLSNNSFTGTIPHPLCDTKSLSFLDLSMNQLFGGIPQCLSNLQQLHVLDLSSNNISGVIPNSISKLVRLKSLHLNRNKLHGQIPLSLMNCRRLISLDLGENKLYGSVPTWNGEYLSSLTILRLRQNKLNGSIPLQLCHLTSLQVLDLAHNNISGTIPRCFSNFSGMVSDVGYWDADFDLYSDKIKVVVKGMELEYSETLSLVTSLDLSDNNLVGEIHEELMILSALMSFNLSKNKLEGTISEKIGQMVSLESLDLSENQLSGRIPQNMSVLTSLSHLNFSYNKLSGTIPSGYQLQTLNDPSIYIGNPGLCGDPLNKCLEAHVVGGDKSENTKDSTPEINWFYIGMACGHVVGFWRVCGALFFNRPWRVAYFQFLNGMKDWLLTIVAVNVARLKRRLERNQVDG